MRIDFNAPLSRAGSRRQSRVVARQHSYDDDIKATAENVNNKDTGLELPTIPRRYEYSFYRAMFINYYYTYTTYENNDECYIFIACCFLILFFRQSVRL